MPSDVTRRAIVTIDDGPEKYVSLKEGFGSVKFDNLSVGIHDIKVSYAGDSNYSPLVNTTRIEVTE